MFFFSWPLQWLCYAKLKCAVLLNSSPLFWGVQLTDSKMVYGLVNCSYLSVSYHFLIYLIFSGVILSSALHAGNYNWFLIKQDMLAIFLSCGSVIMMLSIIICSSLSESLAELSTFQPMISIRDFIFFFLSK